MPEELKRVSEIVRERVLAARMAMLRRVQAAAPHLLLDDASTPLENARMDPGADRSGWGDAYPGVLRRQGVPCHG